MGNPVIVIGGGVAGIIAALDLANAGIFVHLVEKRPDLGGHAAILDKLYPTDHCAFCPLWTEIKKCTQHPKITVHTRARVMELLILWTKKSASLAAAAKKCVLLKKNSATLKNMALRPMPLKWPGIMHIHLHT